MRRLTPVIHYLNVETTLENARLALDAGCPGVWLINMGGPSLAVDRAAEAIREQMPDLWLGVNRLDLRASEACAMESGRGLYDAVWADNPGIHSRIPT